jgi:molybdopterin-guanine dinucleotide biosynthesis protein A
VGSMTDTLVGFAVAGGHSRRMGRDKALLPWGESTLLDHCLGLLRAVCSDVRILSGPAPRYLDHGATVILDHVREVGPLGGIEAALASPGVPGGLFLAVDRPFVTVDLLKALLGWAEGTDAVVPVGGGAIQPLCAVYRTACLAPIRACLKAADYRMTGFWPQVRVRQVGEEELIHFGVPAALFDNVNTPADYDRAGAR